MNEIHPRDDLCHMIVFQGNDNPVWQIYSVSTPNQHTYIQYGDQTAQFYLPSSQLYNSQKFSSLTLLLGKWHY